MPTAQGNANTPLALPDLGGTFTLPARDNKPRVPDELAEFSGGFSGIMTAKGHLQHKEVPDVETFTVRPS